METVESCGFCDKYWHAEKECYTKQRDKLNTTQLVLEESRQIDGLVACFSTNNRSRIDIFLDCGTPVIWLINNECWVTSHSFKTDSSWINEIGRAHSSTFLGKGKLHIVTSVNGVSKKCIISDLLYAPSIGINFFYVGVVTAEGGVVHLTESYAFINRNGALDMKATRIDKNIYRLDIYHCSSRQ